MPSSPVTKNVIFCQSNQSTAAGGETSRASARNIEMFEEGTACAEVTAITLLRLVGSSSNADHTQTKKPREPEATHTNYSHLRYFRLSLVKITW